MDPEYPRRCDSLNEDLRPQEVTDVAGGRDIRQDIRVSSAAEHGGHRVISNCATWSISSIEALLFPHERYDAYCPPGVNELACCAFQTEF